MSTLNKILRFAVDFLVWIAFRFIFGLVAIPVLAFVVGPFWAGWTLFAAMVYFFVINDKTSTIYREFVNNIFIYTVAIVETVKLSLVLTKTKRAEAASVA